MPTRLLREIHCCCEPESTLPSMSESDIQPPLAQPWFWWRTMLPQDVHAAEGCGLRDGPLHGAAGRGDGEAFERRARKCRWRCCCGQAGVGVDVAGDVDGVGRGAEAEDLQCRSRWERRRCSRRGGRGRRCAAVPNSLCCWTA